ncbi:tryptophan synthase alpha chain [Clostridia bacterium]|nr:tryptophan synthase alpha chain [Clostridia bacterium]
MKTLTQILNQKVEKKEPIIVAYIMAGDGGLDKLPETIQFLEDNGVSAIEIGIPFSDPVADGPVIQQAGLRALSQKVNLEQIVEKLQTVKTTIPLVIMTYFQLIFHLGVENFIASLENTPVKGLIIPDLPYEHQDFVLPLLHKRDIALVPLVSLTSPKERIQQITQNMEGFIYAVTVNGTTGTRNTFGDNIEEHLAELKQNVNLPVLAGFGVSTLEHVQQFSKVCDGVVIGSKIVRMLHEGQKDELAKFLSAAANLR